MNKEQQIEELKNHIIDNLFDGGTYKLAEALYNVGYRKTFTSELASDTQKAYKEGYIKGIEERESEIEILKIQNKNRGYQPLPITAKPAPPKCSTPSPKSISIDTVKEMNAMCNIDEQRKQAVKEFAEKVKEYINNKVIADFDDSESVKYYTIDLDEFESEIDELLKEC